MNEVKIVNTVKEDILTLFHLFNQATALQGKSGYKVWDQVDKETLEKDLESHLQYKILKGLEIACIFRIQYSDPLIWRDKDQGNAVYLHRVVIDQKFRGQKLFSQVLDWAKQTARQLSRQYMRMDTWADNQKLIDYYRSFGFEVIENYKTPDSTGLPAQNRNLTVALLETRVTHD